MISFLLGFPNERMPGRMEISCKAKMIRHSPIEFSFESSIFYARFSINIRFEWLAFFFGSWDKCETHTFAWWNAFYCFNQYDAHGTQYTLIAAAAFPV